MTFGSNELGSDSCCFRYWGRHQGSRLASSRSRKRAWSWNSKSLSENLIGIEKSEPTLDMRVVTLSPAKEGSPWSHRVASMRTECQMRCGKKSVCFCLITRPVCSEADHGEIYAHVADAIFYRLRTGCQWKAIPKSLAPGSTAHAYFQE
jgi:hypothetical protein